MIFVSAGHNNQGLRKDPGAVSNGYNEADLTVELRDLIISNLKKKGRKFIVDNDTEKLSDYLKRIQTGNGSVVLELHFDSAASNLASGTTAFIEEEADKNDESFAWDLSKAISNIMGVRNRGVFKENESHRGRLGLMREDGIICLLEVCFINNESDMQLYQSNKVKIAESIAKILIRYEDLI